MELEYINFGDANNSYFFLDKKNLYSNILKSKINKCPRSSVGRALPW